MIPPLGGQTGEELGLEAGALERWDHQMVVGRRPKVAGLGVRPFTARKVSTRVLNLIRAVMGSQWREMRRGVTWECLGRMKTRWPAAF